MQYLLDIAPKLVDYHRDSVGGEKRVHSRLQSPEELAATFDEAGAPLTSRAPRRLGIWRRSIAPCTR